eukprot:2320356-Alexandrium_andersonii.AAC.1
MRGTGARPTPIPVGATSPPCTATWKLATSTSRDVAPLTAISVPRPRVRASAVFQHPVPQFSTATEVRIHFLGARLSLGLPIEPSSVSNRSNRVAP